MRSRGRIAKFTCNSGFELVGYRQATCVKNKWNNPVPICVGMELNAWQNWMNVLNKCAWKFEYWDNFLSILIFDSFINCSDILVELIFVIYINVLSAETCTKISKPANGYIKELNKGSIVVFSCEPGYFLNGSSSLYCDGQHWNPNEATRELIDIHSEYIPTCEGKVSHNEAISLELNKK